MFRTNEIQNNTALRESFFTLAEDTFGLSFRDWYASGYWTDNYLPHCLVEDGRVVANVSVNRIPAVWRDRARRYIQLGTVMTHPQYRGRGLSRQLMEWVLELWGEKSDAVYLYANDSVLHFYPKFGFERATEYQFTLPFQAKQMALARKLRMDDPADVKTLQRCYQKSNPFCALTVTDNFGLLMFYCSQRYRDSIYYIEEFDAVAVMDWENGQPCCLDLFCNKMVLPGDILASVLGCKTGVAPLGFAPKEALAAAAEPIAAEDETLFVLQGGENPFCTQKVRFPVLSHA